MPTQIKLLSWNIQIFGDTKIQRNLAANIFATIFNGLSPDVIAVQELVHQAAGDVLNSLLDAFTLINKNNWAGTFVPANPLSSGERDGYLFLWRTDKYAQQQIAGANVQGVFTGDFPNNNNAKGGRTVGFVGLTLANGTHPFIVANYHAPTYNKAMTGSAPATGLVAIKNQAAQLKSYVEGGVTKNWEARFLCADFNVDISDAYNKTTWYDPAMVATATGNATTAKTELLAPSALPSPLPTTSAGYLAASIDNILAGPTANNAGGATIYNTIDLVAEKDINRLIESFLIANDSKVSLGNNSLYARYVAARTYISDHLPLLLTFNLVP